MADRNRDGEGHSRTIESFADTVATPPSVTIRPPDPERLTPDRLEQVIQKLETSRQEIAGLIEHHDPLGEGGMAVVYLGTQTTLGRKVAVKALRPQSRTLAATEGLLREAWVTGALEHPNVVPVYTVSVDPQGHPCIVLKHIEGVPWTDLMGDADEVGRRFGVFDPLEWNLRVLMQVCSAVHFAHSRGIVHCDLKPDNVMIGEFGEVYVLDWGIAVSLGDDGSGRFPLASESTSMMGTPNYMAPELLALPGTRISEQTDVYLLGAVLFEIVSGNPPHRGHQMMEILQSVIRSEPALSSGVPAALGRLVRETLTARPEDRLESADAVRLRLQEFLAHRESERLAQEALGGLVELRRLLADDRPASVRRLELYHVFGACRFGFQQALRGWPENESAAGGLREAIESMARFELDCGSPEAAAALLADLREAPSELVEGVAAARAAREDEKRSLRELRRWGREFDPTIGRRTRVAMLVILGLIWTMGPIAGVQPVEQILSGGTSQVTLAFWTSFFLLVAGSFAWFGRRTLMATAYNRRVLAGVLFVPFAQAALQIGAKLGGIDPIVTTALFFFLWFTVVTLYALLMERSLFVASLGYLAGFLGAMAYPDERFWIMSCAHLVMTICLAFTWRSSLFGISSAQETTD